MVQLDRLRFWRWTREDVVHFVKFAMVGLSGVALNASLFLVVSMFIDDRWASPLVFVACGQYSFWAHAFFTWRSSRMRPFWKSLLLFTAMNWFAGWVNFSVYGQVAAVYNHWHVPYVVALLASVPLTYAWSAFVVFPKTTLPGEYLRERWIKFVE